MNIRPEVMKFAEAMERKLQENDYKGGWQDMWPGDLLRRIDQEWAEVKGCNDEELLGEAADVANFLMMLCDVRGCLLEKMDATEPGCGHR